jgi:phosphatidylserine/phosphatidylglycerophosphate/cardiolipin synthase-like enzyme
VDGLTAELLHRVTAVARTVPRPLLEQFCGMLSQLPLNPGRGPTGALLRGVAQPSARELLADLISFWMRKVPDLRPDQLAWAIQAAALADEERVRSQSVELVWTGPVADQTSLRRTEQALLEIINGARESLILMTFAAYKVPQVSDALLAAARRGVEILFIAESPDASGGKVSFAGFQALGEPLVRKSSLYIWPLEKRVVDTAGHGALHAKCAVGDEDAAFISSANLTGHALTLNMELGVLIRGGELPRQTYRHLRELIQTGVLRSVAAE